MNVSCSRSHRLLAGAMSLLSACLAACAHRSAPEALPRGESRAAQVREVFPGVRLDPDARAVEFDAEVSPMLIPDQRAPLFFLEQLVCSPDTREHESLLVTRVRPSHIHAALLLAGMTPGEPGRWRMHEDRLVPIDPTGERVELRFVFRPATGGAAVAADPLTWIASADGASTLAGDPASPDGTGEHPRPLPGWVFAGSRIVSGARSAVQSGPAPEVYEADGAGTVIGLTSFGSELISWSRTISPDAGVDAPTWIARFDAVPPPGTPVVVRISREP